MSCTATFQDSKTCLIWKWVTARAKILTFVCPPKKCRWGFSFYSLFQYGHRAFWLCAVFSSILVFWDSNTLENLLASPCTAVCLSFESLDLILNDQNMSSYYDLQLEDSVSDLDLVDRWMMMLWTFFSSDELSSHMEDFSPITCYFTAFSCLNRGFGPTVRLLGHSGSTVGQRG